MTSRSSSTKRPTSGSSHGAWQDDGLDASGGRADSHQNENTEFESRNLGLGANGPAAMEEEVYMEDEIRSADQEKPRSKPPTESGTKRFQRGIRSVWATSSLLNDKDKDNSKKRACVLIKELVVYVVFLVVLCILTLGMTSSIMYYYTKMMQELFLDGQFEDTRNTFRGMTTTQDFWRFAEGPLISGLYKDWESLYNEDLVEESERNYIYFENRMIGVPRMRQIKVKNDSCQVHSDFENEIKHCYDAYSSLIEETAPLLGSKGTGNWTYNTEQELSGSAHHGMIATYSGAGYVQNLARNSTDSLAIIADLKNNLWIDRGTRAVFIDFSVYNANINLFCIVRLLVEFPATGGVVASSTFRTVKLIRYVTAWDWVVLGFECVFVAFIVYYAIEEILEMKKHKLKYLKDIWNWLDMFIILLSIVCIGFNIYRWWMVDHMLDELLSNPNKYGDFDFLSYWQFQFNYVVAVVVFAAWVKVFKYVSFSKTMTQLTTTIGKARKDLLGFLLMFMIIFFAFAQLGYLLFGTQVRDFSTLAYAMLTLFRIIMGDFDFQELEYAHRILGPLYFIFYVFFVFFVLLNMFLAIINDTYSEVKGELAAAKNEGEMSEFFKTQYNKMMSKMNIKREKLTGLQKALANADKDGSKKIDISEFKAEFKLRGYTDQEIERAFAKYDLDGDHVLNEEETRKMQEDLEGQTANLTREYDELAARVAPPQSSNTYSSGEESDDEGTSGTRSSRRHNSRPINGVGYEEFTVLSRRVDRMEHSIGSIVSKIDAVLVKLEAMEKAKLKRRENMGKLLDNINESDVHTDEMKRDQMERLVREELERVTEGDDEIPIFMDDETV